MFYHEIYYWVHSDCHPAAAKFALYAHDEASCKKYTVMMALLTDPFGGWLHNR